ncbi:STAS domain-containing protein [Streptomyces sp. NRRL B-3229]|uniref:STAS domain-containing protein n=1 Tax=Streptomyces sp. NRRL B-3229 TaxID=1463836 RepID=UPI002D21EAF3|nr:STAS domain-containing protein [Streptomyces sp. NRRL B-3229]
MRLPRAGFGQGRTVRLCHVKPPPRVVHGVTCPAAVGRRVSRRLPSTALRVGHACVRRPHRGHGPGAGTRRLSGPHRTAPGTMLLYGRPRPRRLVVARHRWRGEWTRSPAPGAFQEGTGCSSVLSHRRSDLPSLRLRRTYAPIWSAPGRAGYPAPPGPLPDGLPNRGVMSLPQLIVYRPGRRNSALITLAGEIDFESAPLVRASVDQCLRDGIRAIDIDLTLVSFCDCTGLSAFLHAARQTTVAGGTLRLHHPSPMLVLVAGLTGCGFLLLGPPYDPLPPSGDALAVPAPAPPHRAVPPAPVLPGDAR